MLSGILHHLPLRAGGIILGKTLVDGFAVGSAVSERVPTEAVKSAKFLHPGSSVGFVGSCNSGDLVAELFVQR